MKKLLILPLLLLLTACVSYYYPQTAVKDGVYYAEDDPSYNVYSSSYAGVAYYPWSSLDYFYMGYNPYPSYFYGPGYGYGFSAGFSWGYSPWYYPESYYGYYAPAYYAPWYVSHHYYPYYPGWRPHNGYCARHYGCYRGRGYGSDRYAGNGHGDQRYGDGRHAGRDMGGSPPRQAPRTYTGDYGTSRASRRVSTAPSGYDGEQGMVIRSREAKKIGRQRTGPVNAIPMQAVNVAPSSSRHAPVTYTGRRGGHEIRYSAGAKQSRSRIDPVTSGVSAPQIAVVSQPSTPVAAPVNNRHERRSNNRRVATPPPAKSRPREVSGTPTPSHPGSSSRPQRESAAFSASSSRHRGSDPGHSFRREHRD